MHCCTILDNKSSDDMILFLQDLVALVITTPELFMTLVIMVVVLVGNI